MTDIREIDQASVLEFENSINANLRLGGYHMDEHCPNNEVKCYQATLESSDTGRIYLLREPTFRQFTAGETYKVTDIYPALIQPARVESFFRVDLRVRPDLSPILVGTDLQIGSLTLIDGNHRITSHYLAHGDVAGLPVYIYIHPGIPAWNLMQWGFQTPA